MRRFASAALLAAIFVMPAAASAQGAPQEVRFPRGATAVTLEGQAGTTGRVYTFSARSGQYVTIAVSSRADDVAADLVQGRADIAATNREGELTAELPFTGRYTVRVYRPNARRGTSYYSMNLSIR